MKGLIQFLLFLLIGICFGDLLYYLRINQTHKRISDTIQSSTKFSSFSPPNKSKRGEIKDISGIVKWESRIATEPSQIDKAQSVQQGEVVTTGGDGSVTIDFPSDFSFYLSSSSHLSFVQLLPENFVLQQSRGKVTYQKKGMIPLAVRSLHLLTQVDEGVIQIDVDEESSQITISVTKGSARVAFNSLEYISNVVVLSEGENYIFDDLQRSGERASL